MQMKSRGFTLIELMIAVAVIAILAAIAIPAYQQHLDKTRRADAVTGLTSTAQALERCYTRTNTYQDCVANPETPDGYYELSFETLTASSYELKATPAGIQTRDDCTEFTLDHRGNRTAKPADAGCWGID